MSYFALKLAWSFIGVYMSKQYLSLSYVSGCYVFGAYLANFKRGVFYFSFLYFGFYCNGYVSFIRIVRYSFSESIWYRVPYRWFLRYGYRYCNKIYGYCSSWCKIRDGPYSFVSQWSHLGCWSRHCKASSGTRIFSWNKRKDVMDKNKTKKTLTLFESSFSGVEQITLKEEYVA